MAIDRIRDFGLYQSKITNAINFRSLERWARSAASSGAGGDFQRLRRAVLLRALDFGAELSRDLDLDFERRDHVAALHPHLDGVALDREMLGDDRDDLLALKRDDVRIADRAAFMRQKEL